MNKNLYYLSFFITTFIIFTGAIVWYKKAHTPTQTPKVAPSVTKQVNDKFIWGGTFYAALNWNETDISNQMKFLKEHDITTVRADYIPLTSPDYPTMNIIMNEAKENGIQVVLVLQPEKVDYSDPKLNYSEIGKNLAKEAIDRFGNQVDYYQLDNEISGIIHKTGDGQNSSSFYMDKYDRVRDTIIGMQDIISQYDPTAKTIITNNWLGYGALDLLVKDNVKFDIVGWNWFTDNNDMDDIEYAPGKHLNMLKKMQSYGKPVWLVEFNRDHGSVGADGDQQQAKFLSEKIMKYYNSGVFSAIFIHSLFDGPTSKLDQDKHWGIINVNLANHTLSPKPALKVFTDIIKSHPYLLKSTSN